MKKFRINKHYYKKGLTLIELSITIAVIAIFLTMTTLISVSITKTFSRKNEYKNAERVKNAIVQQINHEIKFANMVQLRAPLSKLNPINNKQVETKNFYDNYGETSQNTPLKKYNAIFTKNYKAYKISSHLFDNNVANIDDIPQYNSINPININAGFYENNPNIYFQNNKSLQGLMVNQSTVFFPKIYDKNKYLDPYNDFKVSIYFSKYKNEKTPIGIKVNIKLTSKENIVYFFSEQIELFNLKLTNKLENYIIEEADDNSDAYAILYYYEKELPRQ